MNGTICIRGGRIIDPAAQVDMVGTVVVSEGRIQAVAECDLPVRADMEIDARGLLVVPGLIDLHIHCFEGETVLGLPPDQIGVAQGVTTVVDAGSAGAQNLERFRAQVAGARTRVLAFLNLAVDGLARERGELSDPAMLSPEETLAAIRAHPDFLVGIKARASASVVGSQGVAPIRLAAETAHRAGVPLMVHIGNAPPRLEEVLPLLEAGDIVTHAFHGKAGGIYRDGRMLPEARAALERGVLFDVGHGQSSFSFATARRFLADGFRPATISSDLWRGNETGPVFSLVHTMTKLLHIGMPLPEVIAAATSRAAAALRREAELGRLEAGRAADITLIRVTEGAFPVTDSEGVVETARLNLEVSATIRGGTLVEGEG